MGQSFRFEVSRSVPLSAAERAAIDVLTDEFAIEDQIETYVPGEGGLNWESFIWYEDPASGVVMAGSVRLPDVTVSAIFVGVEHWGRLLGRVRTEVLTDAVWQVFVEGDPVAWVPSEQRFWTVGVSIDDLADIEDML